MDLPSDQLLIFVHEVWTFYFLHEVKPYAQNEILFDFLKPVKSMLFNFYQDYITFKTVYTK
jgi:hypothetical protein